MFVDSDDYLDLTCIEKALEILINQKMQIVCFGVYRTNNQYQILKSDFDIFQEISKNQIFTGLEIMQQCQKDYFHSVCGILIDFDFFKSLYLKFIDGILYEDHCFGTFLFLQAQRVLVLDLYFYYQVNSLNSITRPKEITSARRKLNAKSWFVTIKELEKFPLQHSLIKRQIQKFYFPMFLHCLVFLSQEEQKDYFKRLNTTQYWTIKSLLFWYCPFVFKGLKKLKNLFNS